MCSDNSCGRARRGYRNRPRVEQSPFPELDSFNWCVHVLSFCTCGDVSCIAVHKKERVSVGEYVVLLVTVAVGIVVDVNEVLQNLCFLLHCYE